MMNKINKVLIISIVALLCSSVLEAQEHRFSEINNYKYIIVPLKFDFQSEKNEYLLTSLTKHLFDQEDYETYVEELKIPDDYAMNNCLGLTAILESQPADMFSFRTEVRLKLVNCKNKVLYSHKGSSRKKEFKEAYKDATKKAFAPLRNFKYHYNGSKQRIFQSAEDDEAMAEASQGRQEKKEKDVSRMGQLDGDEFIYQNKTFYLKKIDAGYLLKNRETEERFGFISKTSSGDYLFNSDQINGSAKISAEDNIIVEYFDRDAGKTQKMTLKHSDQ